MKFGSVKNPEIIDYSLPNDPPENKTVLVNSPNNQCHVYVGFPKWNKAELKGFYPAGKIDELAYYASQFNAIELNATFYNKFSPEQIQRWTEKTPAHFRFFPKIHQMISHLKRLNNVQEMVEDFCDGVAAFDSRLGMIFLQLHDNFKYKNFDRLEEFINHFPQGFKLAVELRNTEYFSNPEYAKQLFNLLEQNKVTSIITDTAGRRDLLHMRLTTPNAFIRFVGTNSKSDFKRLNQWAERIKLWKNEGLENLYFFVHQNHEKESPLLAKYFIQQLNKIAETNLQVPALASETHSV